jgi:uncharacterized protein YecT (DUF1311 family)
MRDRRLIATAVALCFAAIGLAAGAQPVADASYETQAFKVCLATRHATVDIVKCEVAEVSRQQALLNGAYQHQSSGLSGADRDKLAADQAAWSVTADAKCASERRRHGLWASVAAQGCAIDNIIQRRLALQ